MHDFLHNFFYVNADTCELGFRYLTVVAPGGGGLEVSTEDVVEQYPLFYGYNRRWCWGSSFRWSWWWKDGTGILQVRLALQCLTVDSFTLYCSLVRWKL
jgi:hypothetical protein